MTKDTDETIIEVRGLSYRRGKKLIFDGCDMDFRRGQVTAVMGPSGTGKTTLLRLITGQLKPDSGTIRVFGKAVQDLSLNQLFELRKSMGMLFQNGALLTDLSVFDNVAFPLREHTRLSESLIRHIVFMKLQAVGLRGAWDLMPSELSGGMARRVALARAIAMDPQLIIYDEPFVGLDPISMGAIVRLIETLNESLGLTTVVVSHDVIEISTVSDYCYILSDGKVIGKGSPEELHESDSPYVRQFMLGEADGPVPFHYPVEDYRTQMMDKEFE